LEYYYFKGGNLIEESSGQLLEILEDSGFSGVLFTYAPNQGDFFTRVARDIDISKKIKYMLAIRPHALSPQYLTMLSHGVGIIMPNRLQINLISGHIKENERQFGGILGKPNDLSSPIERSNYLIDYMHELDRMKKENSVAHSPDFFVTTTNKYVFNTASELNNKMIIPYREYKQGYWTTYLNYQQSSCELIEGEPFDIKGKTVMLSIAPIIRETQGELDSLIKKRWTNDTEYFTYEDFLNFIGKIELDGITHLMMHGWPEQECENIIKFTKWVTSSRFDV
jgi:hypothetical protein